MVRIMTVKPIRGKLEQSLNEFRKNAPKGKGPEAELMNCMIDASPDAVYYKDLNSRYLIANHKTLEIFGLSKEEVIGKHDYEIAPLRNHAEKNIYHDQIVFNSGKRTEVVEQVAMPDGKKAWFQTIRVPRLDDAGKVTGLVGFSRKVTKQTQAHKIQAAQLRLIKYAAHHTVTGFLQKFLDEAEILTDSKIGFYHFLEDDQNTLSLQAWSTNTLLNMCQASGSGLHYPVSEAGVWVDCIHDRKPVIHNHYESLPHKKGLPEGHTPVIRELVVPVFRKEKIVAILGVGNKRTDYNEDDVETIQQLADLAWETVTHKRSEEEIRKLNETLEQRISERTAELENRTEQLQRLALELSGAEDRQRRNIASILHDDFQQQLAYIKMELDIIRKRVEEKVGQRLDTLAKLTAKCIKKSRNLSYGLNPPGLNCSGLLAAIDLLAKDMVQKQGLAVTVRTSPNAEPSSPALASILYRSVRELLLNVSKHAGTDSAVVDIRCNKGVIYLSVEDCGKGFDSNAVKSGQSCEAGFGLYSIEDRMTALGGSMQVITAPGKGCRILLTVPKGVLADVAVNEAALETSVRNQVRDTEHGR
jgi:PAS domain S-box-containing protein